MAGNGSPSASLTKATTGSVTCALSRVASWKTTSHLLLGFGFAAGGASDDGLLLAAQAGSLSNSSRREISVSESFKALILQ